MISFSINLSKLLQLTSFLTVFVSLLFVLFLITVKTKNRIGNIFLSLYLIVRALNLSAYFYAEYIELPIELELLRMDIGSFLEFPFLYLFVLSVLYSNFQLKWKHLLHLLPFLLITFIQLPLFYLVSVEQQNEFADTYLQSPIGVFSTVLAHLQNLFYIVLIFNALKRFKIVVIQNYAINHRFNYKWLFQMNVFISIIFLIALLKNSQKYIDIQLLSFTSFKLLVALSILIFTCWLVVKALHAPKLFTGIDTAIPIVSSSIIYKDTTHQLDSTKKIQLDTLHTLMVEKEPFTNPELSISELATILNIEERELSILINKHLNLNFHKYVNSFRIEKAKALLKDSENKKLTILEILYQVGFNSKSSFNTYFKKETGYTPTEYRKVYL